MVNRHAAASIRRTLCEICGLKGKNICLYDDELNFLKAVMITVYGRLVEDDGIVFHPGWIEYI